MDGSVATPSSLGRRLDLAALAIFLLALVLRILHVLFLTRSPFFEHLLLDSVSYDARALAFLGQGGFVEEGAFYQAPLYPFMLSILYRVFGHDLLAVRLVQAVIGAASCVLVYRLGWRLGGRTIGVVAGVLAALYGTAIHFDAEILRPTLVIFLTLSSLLLLLGMVDRGGWWRPVAAGALLGLGIIARPTLLAFLPLAAGWLWVANRPLSRRGRRAALAAAFVGACAVPVGAVTALNHAATDQAVLVSYNGGINLYLGNNPDYDRTVAIRPGIRWKLLFNEPGVDPTTDPTGWSRHYSDAVIDFARAEPVGFGSLLIKKFVLYWNGHEIPRNIDFQNVVRYSPIVARPMVTFSWIAPLGLLGLVLAWRRRSSRATWSLLTLYIISQMAATVLFFVCARYRMLVVSILVVFAAVAAVEMVRGIRARTPWVVVPIGLFLVLIWLMNLDAYGVSRVPYTRPHYEMAMVVARQGDLEASLEWLAQAEAAHPDDPDPPFRMGTTLRRLDRDAEAAAAFERATRAEPRYADSWFELGLSRFAIGDTISAIAAFERALSVKPHHWQAAMALGEVFERTGELGRARLTYQRALAGRPSPAAALDICMGLARVEAADGNRDRSLGYVERVLDARPDHREAADLLRWLESGPTRR